MEIRLEGFGPPTFGSVDRRSIHINIESINVYETIKSELTPQLTPESQKDSKVDTQKQPEYQIELAEIIEVWPQLSEMIRAAIVAIVKASGGHV